MRGCLHNLKEFPFSSTRHSIDNADEILIQIETRTLKVVPEKLQKSNWAAAHFFIAQTLKKVSIKPSVLAFLSFFQPSGATLLQSIALW
ncbi:hypothetical protein LXL04_018910 [Taraxacum kok-saghyz]